MRFGFHLDCVKNDIPIRRNVVMGAFNLARGLDIYFDTERIEAMRLGIELLCEDKNVAAIIKPVIREVNLKNLLTLSLTMIGISPKTLSSIALGDIIKEIRSHPKTAARELLGSILEAIEAVAPTTAGLLSVVSNN